MEYLRGATASFLAGPRILQCAIVALQGASIVMSPTVGSAAKIAPEARA
jgi:hypothetical protein